MCEEAKEEKKKQEEITRSSMTELEKELRKELRGQLSEVQLQLERSERRRVEAEEVHRGDFEVVQLYTPQVLVVFCMIVQQQTLIGIIV